MNWSSISNVTPRSAWAPTRARPAISTRSCHHGWLREVNGSRHRHDDFRPPLRRWRSARSPGARSAIISARCAGSPLHDCTCQRRRDVETGPAMRARYALAGGDADDGPRRGDAQCPQGAARCRRLDARQDRRAGPGRSAVLDRVYVNGFAKLRSAARATASCSMTTAWSSTTARRRGSASTRFFMTTTTAKAAEVLSWLEFLLDTAWPDCVSPSPR